ncbi:hypothetical protein BDR07DRAFT_1610445 [Suillus spraguei]|nr:hypothetical protein BDR07DRAFT_1610445 [Suillus spraguei]
MLHNFEIRNSRMRIDYRHVFSMMYILLRHVITSPSWPWQPYSSHTLLGRLSSLFPRSYHITPNVAVQPTVQDRKVCLLPGSTSIRFEALECLPAPEKLARYPHSRSTATTRSISWPDIIVLSPIDICYRNVRASSAAGAATTSATTTPSS